MVLSHMCPLALVNSRPSSLGECMRDDEPVALNESHSLPMNSSPYGGSVTTESTDASGRVRSTSRQSPWCRVTPWPW